MSGGAAAAGAEPPHSPASAEADDETAELELSLLRFWRLPGQLLGIWRELDARAARLREEARGEDGRERWDRRPLIAFCAGAVFLTLMEYFGMPRHWQWVADHFAEMEYAGELDSTIWRDLSDPFDSRWGELCGHAWWAVWRVLGFLVFPVVLLKGLGYRLRDQHLRWRGTRAHLGIYLKAFALVLVAVVVASFFEGFQEYYPFYDKSHLSWAELLLWELLYVLQFLSLEFFFRGWWLKAGERLGSHAIFAMVVPYVMIHFGKELAETLGAILAGVFLGTLAMRTRSIWGGFLVHGLVAVSMDVAAMLQTTGLPRQWWP